MGKREAETGKIGRVGVRDDIKDMGGANNRAKHKKENVSLCFLCALYHLFLPMTLTHMVNLLFVYSQSRTPHVSSAALSQRLFCVPSNPVPTPHKRVCMWIHAGVCMRLHVETQGRRRAARNSQEKTL